MENTCFIKIKFLIVVNNQKRQTYDICQRRKSPSTIYSACVCLTLHLAKLFLVILHPKMLVFQYI